MLSPPSPVCRGIGASGAAWQDSTMTNRKAHASPVTRPALLVQVRAEVKGQGSAVINCMKTPGWCLNVIKIQDMTVVVCSIPLCPCVQTCLFVPRAASGAGVEACNHCAEGYLMEEWRCVPSCSAGFYAIEPNPKIADGQRICRR